jgi:hypothetical protein
MKFLEFVLLGSLVLVPVYEVDGDKILVGDDKKVKATITAEDSHFVSGYVEDGDPTKFYPKRRRVQGEWKSNGVIEVHDKYGYKYHLKPTGKKKIGERKTYNYEYKARKK